MASDRSPRAKPCSSAPGASFRAASTDISRRDAGGRRAIRTSSSAARARTSGTSTATSTSTTCAPTARSSSATITRRSKEAALAAAGRRATASTAPARSGSSWPSTWSASRRSPTGRCSPRTAPTSAPGRSRWRASTPGGARSSWRDGAYHGTHAWCTPMHGGVTPEDTANVLTFPYNDARRACAPSSRSTTATSRRSSSRPFRHDAFARSGAAVRRLPAGRPPALRRAGHRLRPRRRARRLPPPPRRLGRATSACAPTSPAIARRSPTATRSSACVGRESLRRAAERVYFTGSYFTSAVPMAAALACLHELEACGAIEHMRALGTALQRRLEEQARSHGVPAIVHAVRRPCRS